MRLPYTYYDNGNEIGVLGGNTIRNFGGGATATYGIYTTYQNNIFVSNNNVGGGSGSTELTYGIYVYYGYNANVTVYNNTVSDTTATLTSTTYGIAVYYAGNTGVDNTVNVKRNTVQGMTNTAAATSAALYGYYIYYTTSNTLYIDSNKFINNKWGNPTGTFTGTIYSFYNYTYTTTPTAGSVEYITNNYIAGNKRTQSAVGTGSHYGMYNYYGLATVNSYNNVIENDTMTTTSTNYGIYMYHYYSTTANIYNNSVRNITKTAGSTGSYYGIYLSNAAYTGTCNYYNNSVYNITAAEPALLYGQYLAATSVTKNVYGNSVYNIQTKSTGNVYGIYQSGGTTVSFYKNSVYGLRTGTGYGYGMYIASGTTNHIYNNLISDIRSDSSVNASALYGMYIGGGTTDNVYYNTIYLNSVSTGTTFGTTALYASTTPVVDLRNNIIVNMSTPGSTSGNVVAYQRSSTTLTTYSDSSNNNCFYAGTPSANRLIYYDGTNADQTIAAFKTRVAPRDALSFSENPPFVNVVTPPYNLHLQTTIPTMCESGAKPIIVPVAITDDYDGDTRNTTTPDVGADEGNFTPYAQFPTLRLKVFLEGFYSPEPGDNKNTRNGTRLVPLTHVTDTIRIYLADSSSSYAFVDTVKIVLTDSGIVTTPFDNITTGKYYIVVRHRNHLETWSKYAVTFTAGNTTNYDFTSAANKAYGDNMKLIGSVYVIYGGDPNQDGDIGALDIPIFISEFGTQGYLSCDFNGDNDVTGVDQQILIQNFGITVARPTTLLIVNPEKGKGLKEYQNKLKELQGRDIKNNR